MRGYSLTGNVRSRGRGSSASQMTLSSYGGRGYGRSSCPRPSVTDSSCSELWNTEDRLAAPAREAFGYGYQVQTSPGDRVLQPVGDLERGIRVAAADAVQNIWQTAEDEMLIVVEAGGGRRESGTEERYASLLERAVTAEQQLKAACAEMRICRAELMIHIGVGGRALQSPPCWEACGSLQNGKGQGKGGSGKSCVDCGFSGKVYFDKGWGKWYCAQCWYDGYFEWPDTSLFLEPRIVLEKYQVSPDDILGQGGFSIVRRGRDLGTGEVVAVKAYSSMESLDPTDPAYEEDKAFYLEKFCHEVATFQRLHAEQDVKAQIQDLKRMGTCKRSSWYVPENLDTPDLPGGLLEMFSRLPEPSMLFVRLEGFTTDANGLPGPSPSTGECCVALELAEYTLDEYLKRREAMGEFLVVAEVQEIFKQLAEVLAMLHAKQFVHCDLKPLNVMYFRSGRWKLIDMDGMVTTGGTASLCDVFYTPLYSAPEFANLTLGEDDIFHVSRLFDVWSLGAMLVELVTLYPWLQDKFNEMYELGPDEFMVWLANPNKDMPLPPVLFEFDARLADLCTQMLEQNVELRASMVEVLLHPFVTDSEMSSVPSEKRLNYMAMREASALQEQAELRRQSRLSIDMRARPSAAGTVVKKRISVLFPVSEETLVQGKLNNNSKLSTHRESLGSAFTDVSEPKNKKDAVELKSVSREARAGSDPSSSQKSLLSGSREVPDFGRDFGRSDLNTPEKATPLTRMSGNSSADSTQRRLQPAPALSRFDFPKGMSTSTNNTSLYNYGRPGGIEDPRSSAWSSIRSQAQAVQARAGVLYRRLQERECLAHGLEAIFWAATEAEASLWREAQIRPQTQLNAISDERRVELEGHVERAARGLQAAQAELWEARDLEKLVRECEGLAAGMSLGTVDV